MVINRHFLISLSTLALLTLGFAGGVAIPSIMEIRDVQVEIDAEYAKIQSRYSCRTQLKETLQGLHDVRERISKLTETAIKEGEALSFVNALENAANTNGVEQQIELKTANQEDLSDWERSVPVTVRIEGQIENAVNYLRDVEQLPYYLTIDSFAVISQSSQSGEEGLEPVRIELNGSVYWITEDVPAIIDNADRNDV